MPYKRIGSNVYTKATGRWRIKQHCRSVDNAKKAIRLLRGLEKGTIKPKDIIRERSKGRRK